MFDQLFGARVGRIEAHLRLLHHAYRHWAAGGFVYAIGDATLDRATRGGSVSAGAGEAALYLQVPAGRVWRPAPRGAPEAPEPLDGMFVAVAPERGALAVLAVFGMHRNRPGFSAVAALTLLVPSPLFNMLAGIAGLLASSGLIFHGLDALFEHDDSIRTLSLTYTIFSVGALVWAMVVGLLVMPLL